MQMIVRVRGPALNNLSFAWKLKFEMLPCGGQG